MKKIYNIKHYNKKSNTLKINCVFNHKNKKIG